MRVFVAGATGAIGRRLVPMLREAGHEVTGMTRSEERAEGLRAAGARAVVCDALDAAAVRAAIAEAAPEVLVHQLTDLPQDFGMRYSYGQTSRLRTDGTRNLLEGARAAGARRFIAQSIAFIYHPDNGPVNDEQARTMAGAPGKFGEAVGAKAPRRVPLWLGKLVAGGNAEMAAKTMRGASNAKAKRELGWAPRYASWRQGFREGLG